MDRAEGWKEGGGKKLGGLKGRGEEEGESYPGSYCWSRSRRLVGLLRSAQQGTRLCRRNLERRRVPLLSRRQRDPFLRQQQRNHPW